MKTDSIGRLKVLILNMIAILIKYMVNQRQIRNNYIKNITKVNYINYNNLIELLEYKMNA